MNPGQLVNFVVGNMRIIKMYAAFSGFFGPGLAPRFLEGEQDGF